ncbi:MAG: hypothetical protein ACK5JD_10845 [Mangrovibacterium sp.]
MAKITDKAIREFFKENYSDVVEYDGLKIEREKTKWGVQIDVKVISMGRKIAWFQGVDNEQFFEKYKTHTDWQLRV